METRRWSYQFFLFLDREESDEMSSSSTTSCTCLDVQISKAEAKLREILPTLPEEKKTDYVNDVWSSLGAAIGWRNDDTVAAASDQPTTDSDIAQSMTKVDDWLERTERFITVVSEFIPGYKPPKRFPSAGIKREGHLTVLWFDYGSNSDVVDQLAERYSKIMMDHKL